MMTQNDLTRGYIKKLVAEIRCALNYLGDNDEEIIRQFAREKIDALWQALKCGNPQRIETNDGIIEGYPIPIASGLREEIREEEGKYMVDEMVVLLLVVNKKEFQYVLKTYDVFYYKDDDFGAEEFSESKYQKVK